MESIWRRDWRVLQQTTFNGFGREQLLQLPCVEVVPDDGRVVSLCAFYDHINGAWHLYLPVSPGQLGRIAGGETVLGSYYAAVPHDCNRDLELPLSTMLRKYLAFSDALRELAKLESDIHRCAAILEKYHLLWKSGPTPRGYGSLLVESELEYLLFLLRSLYDILQAIARVLTRRFVDSSGRRVARELPDSFADVALKGAVPRSADEIRHKWKVPEKLADWYVHEASFFQILRDLRDAIAHQGENSPNVFRLECGFAVDPAGTPWNQFDAWPGDRRWQGRLGSLRALFVWLIGHAIQSTTRFSEAICGVAPLPTGILRTDVRVFIRNPFGARLISLEDMLTQPWEGLESV